MSAPTYWITRFLFQRGLALIYLVAFLILWNQFRPLCGDNGILPVRLFLNRVSFWDAPSIFWWKANNTVFAAATAVGLFFSICALIGLTDAFSTWFSALCW